MNAPAFASLASLDYWRASPQADDLALGYKEWSHFSVLGPDFDLILNLSFAARRSRKAEPRLLILFGDAQDRWDGEFMDVPLAGVEIAAGAADAVMGAASAKLVGGRYRIKADLPRRGLKLDFELTPQARPLFGNAIRLSDQEAINWVVVPHLRATGEIQSGGRTYVANQAPAYHDRNWGLFNWGGDYAWEWATLVPDSADDPTLVYSRMSDRARGLTFAQSLMLWMHGQPSRRFYGRDLTVSQAGALRPLRVFRLPRFTALIGSGRAADVPARLHVVTRGYGDALDIDMDIERFGQIVAPNDSWPGLTALSEAGGRFRAQGIVAGRRLDFSGRVQVEFKHAAT